MPVFVLTHHARAPILMESGTTFHFVTDGIHAVLERAREAAGSRDIRRGGGAATIRQYLTAGLVDEMQVVLAKQAGAGRGCRLPGAGDDDAHSAGHPEHGGPPGRMH